MSSDWLCTYAEEASPGTGREVNTNTLYGRLEYQPTMHLHHIKEIEHSIVVTERAERNGVLPIMVLWAVLPIDV